MMHSQLGKYEKELLSFWIQDMKTDIEYREPLLDVSVTSLVNYICRTLKQDIHVFVSSVELLEDYIKLKEKLIHDPALVVVTIVLICCKFTGDQDIIKSKNLETILFKLTRYQYDAKNINLQELEVLTTLNAVLPLWTVVDDLKVLVSKFESEYNIKVSVIPACVDTLELIYISRQKWFVELKEIYAVNTDSLMVFKKLISSRNYLPLSILGFVLQISKYRISLNTERMLKKMALEVGIHMNHITACIKVIDKLYIDD